MRFFQVETDKIELRRSIPHPSSNGQEKMSPPRRKHLTAELISAGKGLAPLGPWLERMDCCRVTGNRKRWNNSNPSCFLEGWRPCHRILWQVGLVRLVRLVAGKKLQITAVAFCWCQAQGLLRTTVDMSPCFHFMQTGSWVRLLPTPSCYGDAIAACHEDCGRLETADIRHWIHVRFGRLERIWKSWTAMYTVFFV